MIANTGWTTKTIASTGWTTKKYLLIQGVPLKTFAKSGWSNKYTYLLVQGGQLKMITT